MDSRYEYVEKMKRQLDEWNLEIDTLEGRIATVTGPGREKLRPQLDKVRETYEGGGKKLGEIQNAGEASWEHLKGEAEHFWATLRHSINYFRSQI